MPLAGLPDFGSRVGSPRGLSIWPAYESGSFTVLPDDVYVPVQPDGRPDLALALVRSEILGLPPDPYGFLDFTLGLRSPLDLALSELRAEHPDATVMSPLVVAGFLHLASAAADVTLADALKQPTPMPWDGLESGRLTMTLPGEAASYMLQALSAGALMLQATVELEFSGVAPRLPIQASFDPKALLASTEAAVSHDGRVARAELESYFRQDPTQLPIRFTGDVNTIDRQLLAETLTDWARMRFGTFVASIDLVRGDNIELPREEETPHGSFTWNLSDPLWCLRPLTLTLDPLLAVRKYVSEKGVDALVTRTETPPVPTGLLLVTITANLPQVRLGILELGVMLEAPPRPPTRMQVVRAAAELRQPSDLATLHLRLAPGEPEQYTSYGYAVLTGGVSGEPPRGAAIAQIGRTVRMRMTDFPVDFIPVTASSALLDLCTLQLTLHQEAPSGLPDQTYLLDSHHRSAAFTQPKGSQGALLTVEARPNSSDAVVKLGPMEATRLMLDLGSFPGYGPKQVDISVEFFDSSTVYAIQLLPDGLRETQDSITTLSFTPEVSRRRWAYASVSPFLPGYRYREFRNEPPLAPWSAVRDPGKPLVLTVGLPPSAVTTVRG